MVAKSRRVGVIIPNLSFMVLVEDDQKKRPAATRSQSHVKLDLQSMITNILI
jgi:hypothetical protein